MSRFQTVIFILSSLTLLVQLIGLFYVPKRGRARPSQDNLAS